eukprot:1366005-Rhodomonas_salina.8
MRKRHQEGTRQAQFQNPGHARHPFLLPSPGYRAISRFMAHHAIQEDTNHSGCGAEMMTNCNGGDNGSLLVLGLLMMHEEGGEWRLCSLSSRPSRRSTGNSTMNNLFLFAVVGVVLFAGATAQILDDGDDDVSVLQCPLGLFEHATGIQAVRDNLCTYRAQCQPVSASYDYDGTLILDSRNFRGMTASGATCNIPPNVADFPVYLLRAQESGRLRAH